MGDYKRGDLSRLLQTSGTPLSSTSGSFLTPKKPPQQKHSLDTSMKQTDKMNEKMKQKKKKKKKVEKQKIDNSTPVKEIESGQSKDELASSKPKKRKKGNQKSETDKPDGENRSVNGINDSKTKKRKKQKKTGDEATSKSHQPGFNPPPGIVHESVLTQNDSKTGTKSPKKRKLDHADSDDDGVESKKSKQEKTRHRRDRLKKKTENKTIFIGNIPLSIQKKDLLKTFKAFGEIESMRLRCLPVNDPSVPKKVVAIKGDFHPGRHNCVAYICFKEEDSARKALSQNGKEIEGLHIRVDMAGKIDKDDMKLSVFVGNLPYDLEEEKLRSHFDDCGKIENVRIVRDRKTCIGKGFGYVKFADRDGLSLATKLHGSTLKKREIRVMPCVAKVKKPKNQENTGGKKQFDKNKFGDKKKPHKDRKPDQQKQFNSEKRGNQHQKPRGGTGQPFGRDKQWKPPGGKPGSHIVFDGGDDGENKQTRKYQANNKPPQKFKKTFNKTDRKHTKKSFRPSNVRKNPFHTKLAKKDNKKPKQKKNKPRF